MARGKERPCCLSGWSRGWLDEGRGTQKGGPEKSGSRNRANCINMLLIYEPRMA